MNRPIRVLAIGLMVLFVALLTNVTYLQFWQAQDLNNLSVHPNNRRVLDANFSKRRGAITTSTGRVIAESTPTSDGYEYQRSYRNGPLFAHITGYFSRDWGVAGVEATQNAVLSGTDSRFFVDRVVDLLGNHTSRGGTVGLTINQAAQRAAYDGVRALGANTQVAVVALEPATGRILAMVSNPGFDPNKMASHDFKAVNEYRNKLIDDPLNPLDNRAIETVLPPGSTFKLVTAAAAMETGRYNPDTQVFGGVRLKLPQSTKYIYNESRGSCGGDKISLTQALAVSCNVAFASVGLDIGDDALREQAEKFGFGQRYFHDLDDALTKQSVSRFPADPDKAQTALSAIGQFDVAASPLQMAMVTAAIANNGTVMRPYLVDEIRSADVEVLDKTRPSELTHRAVSPATARGLTDMMVAVVDSGTGKTAQIPGIKVAGKTGTAQSAADRPPYAWFVSFAPADDPQVAVAVLVQDANVDRDQISGSGLAAPIAKAIMEAVIRR